MIKDIQALLSHHHAEAIRLKNASDAAEPFKREALQQLAIETIALKNILENQK
jgi:hypothetical protein